MKTCDLCGKKSDNLRIPKVGDLWPWPPDEVKQVCPQCIIDYSNKLIKKEQEK